MRTASQPANDEQRTSWKGMPSAGAEAVMNDPTDQRFMRDPLALAGRAAAAGEVPVAALIVERDEIVAQAYNRREMWQDPTAHAEMIAIRKAAARRGTWRLTGLTLYVTLEPCTMCIGAIIHSRLLRIVFGAWDPKAGACGSLLNVPSTPRLNHFVQVTGGVGEKESQALLQSFFRTLRTEAGVDAQL
jgi:tRNA(adenine34) deaminase